MMGRRIVFPVMQGMLLHLIMQVNAPIAIQQVQGGQITASTMQDLQTAVLAILQIRRRTITMASAHSVIRLVIGPMVDLTMQGKRIASPVIQTMPPRGI